MVWRFEMNNVTLKRLIVPIDEIGEPPLPLPLSISLSLPLSGTQSGPGGGVLHFHKQLSYIPLLQGYLAHKNAHPPGTLQQAYGPTVVLGGGHTPRQATLGCTSSGQGAISDPQQGLGPYR